MTHGTTWHNIVADFVTVSVHERSIRDQQV